MRKRINRFVASLCALMCFCVMWPIRAMDIQVNGGYQFIQADKALDAQVQMRSIRDTNNQTWLLVPESEGQVTIQNLETGQVLGLDGKAVCAQERLNSKKQRWKIVENQIVSVDQPDLYIAWKKKGLCVSKEKSNWTLKRVSTWNGPVLSASAGAVQGPSGRETYYNLDMSGVVANMRSLGYEYEYWVREDGAKMFGEYVMVAAELGSRPKGTIVETSLGLGIVCDTGGFASTNPTQLDVATNW